MRRYSAFDPLSGIPVVPDVVDKILITGASSGQAMDWNGSPANAAAGPINIARVTFMSTAGALMAGVFNAISTHATISSGSSATTGTTAGSTGNSVPVLGQGQFQIPSFSTGYSVSGFSSGWAMVEYWRM